MDKFRVFVFVLVSVSFSYAQGVVGKMYSKKEADFLYGNVITVVAVQSSFLSKFLINQDGYIMFRIFNDNLFILDGRRNPLYPESAAINPGDIFRCFSISMVSKTLSAGNELTTRIELRSNNIVTKTNGNFTLEMGILCPPYCD